MIHATALPSDNLVHNFLLFGGRHPQIDTGGFYAFMPHQIGQQSYVVVFFNEIFGKPVPKRVRMHHCQRNAIYFGVWVILQAEKTDICSNGSFCRLRILAGCR